MSTELYIQAFINNEPHGMPLKLLKKIINNGNSTVENESIIVKYENETIIFDISVINSNVSSISRPINNKKLWNDIYRILNSYPYIAYMPGSECYVYCKEINQKDYPDEMLDSLGKGELVNNADEIRNKLCG